MFPSVHRFFTAGPSYLQPFPTTYRFFNPVHRYALVPCRTGMYIYIMFWIIFISILIATLIWILLAPVILYLDTPRQRYRLALPGILSVVVVPSDEIFHLRVRAFLIPFRIHPFRPSTRRRKKMDKDQKQKAGKAKKKKGIRNLIRNMDLGRKMLGNIRIRRIYLDLDTDDFMLNTWLVPAFSMVNNDHIHLQANFEGRASLVMDARTSLGSMVWTMAKYKYHTMLNR